MGVDDLECYHVLHWLTALLHPKSYLEIGVREGASLCCVLAEERDIVSFVMKCLMDGRTFITDEIVERIHEGFTSRSQNIDLYLFDNWSYEGGAGGRNRLVKLLEQGFNKKDYCYDIFDGDSKETVPSFFDIVEPDKIDLIFVDGDHSVKGVWSDLNNVTGRFKVLVVHDLYHPQHSYVANIFTQYVRVHGFPHFIVGRRRFGVGVVFDIS